jgi:SAM-dependent methyltransferase
MESHRCWCGGALDEAIGPHYRRCLRCGAAVLATLPGQEHFDVADDERDFYGKTYWTEYSRARNFPDITERACSDLSERCLFWLERLVEVVQPPGRALEVGCGHGGFVRLMQELGFDAMGTELSPWVIDFARRTFTVPVVQGRLETLVLEPGFKCIAAFDVLEHLEDPLGTISHCAALLAADGVLLLQTPWYRGEGPGWSMFQKGEHIHLFTEESVRLLLERAGFRQILLRPSLFPYDMWVVATRGPLPIRARDDRRTTVGWQLPAAFQALLDLGQQMREVRERLNEVEADRNEVEADRTTRLADVETLTALLRQAEGDRATRLADVETLTALLRRSGADRATRLADVEMLTALLRQSEADRAIRLADIETLTALLQQSEEDRAVRLAEIETLNADRAARLEQIHELTRLLRESEADRTARLEVIQALQARLAEIERTRIWRLYSSLGSLTMRRKMPE